ncbi:MAG TPA: response regulator [Geminicoccaceae bacterium]|nr:response regulator [Geminicoccaceae bacterium]
MRQGELRGLEVLVVEDDPLVAFDLEDLLGELGCVALGPAGSIARALARLEESRPDLALLDVELGGTRAAPVAAALAAAGVPFALVTGYPPTALVEPPFAGAPLLPKPYTLDDLRRVLLGLAGAARP